MSAAFVGSPAPVFREARSPPEARGLSRDRVRLLVTDSSGSTATTFDRLPVMLHEGDLLVVNRSATLAASLPAYAEFGEFRLSLSTDYGRGEWLAEPRWSAARPGPLPLSPGDTFRAAELEGRVSAMYPGIPRLSFVRLEGDVVGAMDRYGSPIRYGYVDRDLPLQSYQTVFGEVPGSAEMPSAARPFSTSLVRQLRDGGVEFAAITLHTGVSSLETGDTVAARVPVYPEPFEVPESTARAIADAREGGRRVIGVGTTVLRALESATCAGRVHSARGFTQAYLEPKRPIRTVDGLITGFHSAGTSHLALIAALGCPRSLAEAYAFAATHGFLCHEFGDSQLILLN